MRINTALRTCKLTAALKDLTGKAAHHLVVNFILLYHACKRRESTCVGNRRIREKQMEVLEMAERESRNWFLFGKIRESEMHVSDCIQKINMSGQAFCSWCHETKIVEKIFSIRKKSINILFAPMKIKMMDL